MEEEPSDLPKFEDDWWTNVSIEALSIFIIFGQILERVINYIIFFFNVWWKSNDQRSVFLRGRVVGIFSSLWGNPVGFIFYI